MIVLKPKELHKEVKEKAKSFLEDCSLKEIEKFLVYLTLHRKENKDNRADLWLKDLIINFKEEHDTNEWKDYYEK